MTLPRSTPSAEGVDSRGLHAFLDEVETTPDLEPHSVMILRHGRVVAEGWWAPFTAERPHAMYSVSKSFTSTALGFAVQEGLLGPDDRVLDFLDDRPAVDPHGYWDRMRIRHIASMSSGHLDDKWFDAIAADPDEPIRGFLTLPPDREPGTVFAYNQPATYTLAAILQRLTGGTLVEYLRPRLFDPLGIESAHWDEYPRGRNLGFTGLHVTTEAVAKLGELYLRRGAWQGKRLLTAEWVAEATSIRVPNPGWPSPDWQQGYGFQFWMSRHGYRGDGAFGQLCMVLPEQDAVVAYTGSAFDFQALLDIFWTELLPAFDGEVSVESDRSLDARLSELALPSLSSRTKNPNVRVSLEPANGMCTDQKSLKEVEILQDGGNLSVVLKETEAVLRFRVGSGEWAVSEPEGDGHLVPVAASGGWKTESLSRFDVLFLETPHRLTVEADLRAGRFKANWINPPLLDDSLLGLCAQSA